MEDMKDESVHNFNLLDGRHVHLRRYRQPGGVFTYSIAVDGSYVLDEPAPNPFDWKEIEATVRKKYGEG